MKKKIKTLWTAAFSIALKNYVNSFVDHPHSPFMDDLMAISEMSKNSFSVEIVVNTSVHDDKDFNYDENL